jgi:outer membrane lipoprotein carrier protein
MRPRTWIIPGILLSILIFSYSSPAAVLSLDELVDRIQQQYNRAEDLNAEFTQEAYNQAVDRAQKARGKVYLKKPNLMRWDYEGPDLQHFIIDGETFWWYTPQNNQVIKQPASATFDSKIPLSFLGGVGNLRQDFHISYAEEVSKQGWQALLLLPKKTTGNLKKLIMEVEGFEIRRVSMQDAFGNKTTLLLSNMRINQNIAIERFRFVPPPGVQVISPEDFTGGF